MSEHKKSKKREREPEVGFKKLGGVNFDTVVDRQVGDRRHERERMAREATQSEGVKVRMRGQLLAD
jgi:hypothetical protein